MAKSSKDTKTMERAATSYSKMHRVDIEDEIEMPYDKIVPQHFTATSGPRPLGIEPIPNLQEKIDSMFEILITDFTCELSDSNTELNKVKFTWQFAETTPKLDVPTSPGIYNDKFNPVYS